MRELGNWPQVIKDVGFDFSWDNAKVWQLDVPVIEKDSAWEDPGNLGGCAA